ncbi:hypothetical protein N431DRAFT_51966, partial [Stipitochalara longipes BDJ]
QHTKAILRNFPRTNLRKNIRNALLRLLHALGIKRALAGAQSHHLSCGISSLAFDLSSCSAINAISRPAHLTPLPFLILLSPRHLASSTSLHRHTALLALMSVIQQHLLMFQGSQPFHKPPSRLLRPSSIAKPNLIPQQIPNFFSLCLPVHVVAPQNQDTNGAD